MRIGRNVTDLGSTINAGIASILAGNNITFDTVKTGSSDPYQVIGSTIDSSTITNQLSRVNVGGNLLMAVTGNLNLTGTQLSIGTCGTGAGKLLAGGSMNIAAVVVEAKSSFLSNPNTKNWDKQIHENQTVVGANLASTGDLLVSAGINRSSDLNIKCSSLSAGGTLTLKASKDLNATSVSESTCPISRFRLTILILKTPRYLNCKRKDFNNG